MQAPLTRSRHSRRGATGNAAAEALLGAHFEVSAPVRTTKTSQQLHLQDTGLDSPISNHTHHDIENSPAKPKTVSITGIQPFLKFNKHVFTGYRLPNLSYLDCLRSLWYFHNETLNIYTHLLPGLISLRWACIALTTRENGVSTIIGVGDLGSALCFFASAAYHLLMPAMTTQDGYDRLIKFDVWGVWLVNASAACQVTLTLFPCTVNNLSSVLRAAGILGPMVGSFLAVFFLAKSITSRALAFALCWAARLGSILLSAATGATSWPGMLLPLNILAELSPALGAAINVRRWPELHAPGQWDYANSHTLMHVLVACGMLGQHYIGLSRAGLVSEDTRVAQCAAEQWGSGLVDAMTRLTALLQTARA